MTETPSARAGAQVNDKTHARALAITPETERVKRTIRGAAQLFWRADKARIWLQRSGRFGRAGVALLKRPYALAQAADFPPL